MNKGIAQELKGWIPYKIFYEKDGLYLRWLYVGSKTFLEPFFDETIAKCRSLPENSKLRYSLTHINLLPEWSTYIDSISPTAIIFHVSRCGSTMLSQLLGLDFKNSILAEVPLFDELLRWGFNNQKSENIQDFLQSAISFYGSKRKSAQEKLFIKTDSWHIHFYHHYRLLYPNIPFLLLYRNPDEIIKSHQKQRGMQAVQGVIEPSLFGFQLSEIKSKNMDEYLAMVMETYLTSFINILQNDPLAIPINYNEGMMNIVQKTAQITQMKLGLELLLKMEKRLSFHSKNRDTKFALETHSLEKHPKYLDKCFELYFQLECIRLKRLPAV